MKWIKEQELQPTTRLMHIFASHLPWESDGNFSPYSSMEGDILHLQAERTAEAGKRRELTLIGVLSSLAGGEGGGICFVMEIGVSLVLAALVGAV